MFNVLFESLCRCKILIYIRNTNESSCGTKNDLLTFHPVASNTGNQMWELEFCWHKLINVYRCNQHCLETASEQISSANLFPYRLNTTRITKTKMNANILTQHNLNIFNSIHNFFSRRLVGTTDIIIFT